MSKKQFTYPALLIQQTEEGASLVLFAAPASEVSSWSGVPQKRKLEDGETTGFQRDLNKKRLKNLQEFYSEPRNVIQNPLLAAARSIKDGGIVFTKSSGEDNDSGSGEISIFSEDLGDLQLLDLLRKAKEELIRRVPSLQEYEISPSRIHSLKIRAVESPELDEITEGTFDEDFDLELDDESAETEVADESTGSVLSEESHIQDFYEEIASRIMVLEEYNNPYDRHSFLGFDKDSLISFLQPVLIVDGQHRLKGAVESVKNFVNQEKKSELEVLILEGMQPDEAQDALVKKHSRLLPISLLLSDDPAEHVFQFVIVNQKATPIDKALLGTIVSTSLSNDELDRVSTRLENAGIPLEDSRAVAFLTRYIDSPFYNLVERGLASDEKDLLPWTVLSSLIRIFRDLQGGKLFHITTDFANKWRRGCLDDSTITASYGERGFDSAFDFWSSPDGPWREVFLAFWSAVRDILGNTTDNEASNYWGKARSSQLFNKISLTILAADFFKYISSKDIPLESAIQVSNIVHDWLSEIDHSYFGRQWDLRGVKKASGGISKQWAKLWTEYRDDPQRLPRVTLYRKASSE